MTWSSFHGGFGGLGFQSRGRLAHRVGDGLDEAPVEGGGDDVVGTQPDRDVRLADNVVDLTQQLGGDRDGRRRERSRLQDRDEPEGEVGWGVGLGGVRVTCRCFESEGKG